jgi:cyclopropane-fatty-acyl-phospholipid synthase
MSIQPPRTAARTYAPEQAPPAPSPFAAWLRRILARPECGRLVIDPPSGERFVIEGSRPGPHAHLKVHSWKLLWRLTARGDIGFAESYIAGEWTSPNLAALMTFAKMPMPRSRSGCCAHSGFCSNYGMP